MATIIRKEKVKNGYDITINMIDGELEKIKTFLWESEAEPSDAELSDKITYLENRFKEKNLLGDE